MDRQDTNHGRDYAETIVDGDEITSYLSKIKTRESLREKPKTAWQKFLRVMLYVGILLAMFMVSLNTTVIAPAMSIIATDMDALSEQTWIATAYLLAFNSSQPLSGKVCVLNGS